MTRWEWATLAAMAALCLVAALLVAT